MDENNNRHDYDREHHELHHVLGWVKVLLISFAAFLGAYLATYYIVDQADTHMVIRSQDLNDQTEISWHKENYTKTSTDLNVMRL